MVSSLFKPRADLDIEVEGEPFYPGDTIEVRLLLSSQENLHIAEGWVELLCIETYWGSRERVPPVSAFFTPKVSSFLSRRMQPFLTDAQVSNVLPQSFVVSLPLPTDALPTVRGRIASIKWVLRASLNIPHSRDIAKEKEIIVLSPPMGSTSQEKGSLLTDVTEKNYQQCTVSLVTPSVDVRAGSTVAGTLRARAKRDVRFSKVHVRLVCWECAGTKEKKAVVDKAVFQESVSLSAAAVREWPFVLRVPNGLMPSVSTYMAAPNGGTLSRVTWFLEAILSKSILADFRVEQDIRVHTV